MVRQIDNPEIFLPILVVSGDYSQEVKQRALASGAKDFLPRPFDAIEIELRIENLLEARFLQLELKRQNHHSEERVIERTAHPCHAGPLALRPPCKRADLMPRRDQLRQQVPADETGRSGHGNPHYRRTI